MGVPAHHRDAGPEVRVVRAVPCRGHAFDEDLRCPCGMTWFLHQESPRRCNIGAQRCKRATGAASAPGSRDAD